MPEQNSVYHQNQGTSAPRFGQIESGAAVVEGYALCFDHDHTIADGEEYQRRNVVEAPSVANAEYFAGVAARSYNAKTGTSQIQFYPPGSVCPIHCDAAVTAGDFVSFLVDSVTSANTGKFSTYNGTPGRGSARVLETTSASGLALAQLFDGPETGGTHYVQCASGAALSTPAIGLTKVQGGITIAADATYALANANPGRRKCFHLVGALTTQDLVISASAIRTNLSAVATVELDGANDYASFVSVGRAGDSRWMIEDAVGPTLA